MNGVVEVTINNNQIEWYRSHGYDLPTIEAQLWAKNRKGEVTKNGIERRVAKGTKIYVRREDLPPNSNLRLDFVCEMCGKKFYTQWRAANLKRSCLCKACASKQVKDTGCHTYWVGKLITENPDAACDISGEKDKRFLVLHHLLSRALGGKDEPPNYVILSANYHLAFHVWNGGMNVPCHPDDYYRFKEAEALLP